MCCNGSNGFDNLDLLKHTEAHHRQKFWHSDLNPKINCLSISAFRIYAAQMPIEKNTHVVVDNSLIFDLKNEKLLSTLDSSPNG